MIPDNKEYLLIIGSSSFGGAQKVFLNIASEMSRMQYKVQIFAPKGFLYEELSKKNLNVIEIENFSLINIYSIYKKINNYIKGKKVALINTHLTNCSFMISVLNLFLNVTLICSIHNKIYNESDSFIKKFIYKYVYKIINYFSKCIIVNSLDNKLDLINKVKIESENIYVVHNGIAVDNFHKIKVFHSNPFIVGFAGRISAEKGLHVLINAISKVQKINIKCRIVGNGPLINDLKIMANDLGLAGSIEFLGYKSNVLTYINEFDVLVLPSYSEVFPLIILEGFAMSKVVIASDIGGIAEIINDGHNGLLFEVGNSKKLAEKIEYVFNNWSEMMIMRETARNDFKNKYTLSSMIENMINIYHKYVL